MKMTKYLSATPNGAHEHKTDYMQQCPVAQPAKNVPPYTRHVVLLLLSSATSTPARNFTLGFHNHSCELDCIYLFKCYYEFRFVMLH
jgi:hypothetical protein